LNLIARKPTIERLQMKKILRTAALVALVGMLTGCAGTKPLKPAFYSAGASAAVSLGLRNSPVLAAEMRTLQPLACSVVAGTNLAPAALAAVPNNQPIHSETLAVYNILMGLYNVAFNALSDETQATVRPYAAAIFCDGMAAGLATIPPPTLLKSSRKVKKGETVTTTTLGDPQWPFATMTRPPLP